MSKEYKEILKKILGEEMEQQLITQAAKEYQDEVDNIDDLDIILESYYIAIFLIGISKKKIEFEKYNIHFIDIPDINIKTKEFCSKYKKYIDKVENFKFGLFRKLIK